MADIDSTVTEPEIPTWDVRDRPNGKIMGTVLAETEAEAKKAAEFKFGPAWFLMHTVYFVERRSK